MTGRRMHLARLYSCRIRWSASGQPGELAPLLNVDVADHGGRADFSLPDGRAMRLILHSDDWPFDASNSALILILQDLAPGGATRAQLESGAMPGRSRPP